MAKIRVFKIVASGWPDYPLYVREPMEIAESIESIYGLGGEHEDLDDCATVNITFAYMEESEYEALEDWQP